MHARENDCHDNNGDDITKSARERKEQNSAKIYFLKAGLNQAHGYDDKPERDRQRIRLKLSRLYELNRKAKRRSYRSADERRSIRIPFKGLPPGQPVFSAYGHREWPQY